MAIDTKLSSSQLSYNHVSIIIIIIIVVIIIIIINSLSV